jgi:hypothetical protein
MTAEPISQLVASMPQARFLGPMALFLGPAIAIYTLFSIYPLIATMGLSTYTSDAAGGYQFVGIANFVTLLTDSFWSKPFWNVAKNNLIFFCVHMAVQNPIGIALAGLLSLTQRTLSHDHLPADDAFRGHRRLFLESNPVAVMGRRGGRPEGGRPGKPVRAVAWPASTAGVVELVERLGEASYAHVRRADDKMTVVEIRGRRTPSARRKGVRARH